jgi:hypothetical protein
MCGEIKTPRVKTFAWRLIRKALVTGARDSKFSKHIAKECSRCGMLETDSIIFSPLPKQFGFVLR